ncbi:UDP-GlcNAc:undecaprenyl-phosphate GlcNAc-1-phosphate transferase [Catalinimonas alkaloidigena]|uniref:glycosyltransferase family 4 protein n=1 Tax=Catalinimonas alkaloidigena TaxID=1075417 RepID=UPI0024066DF2|nr:MraY family glycosyltransferase [Catalinimonas alkaloidigena]MDF9801117.1 UDP-GlcNAc:undecaprenyl-phosphate GlcNAc-1-phosphate transferase [Catalinimonas alkaloidigena]
MITDFLNTPLVSLSVASIFAFIIVSVTIPVIVRVAMEKHLMEEPNGRSSHAQKTPNFGGIAIFASVVMTFLLATPETASSALNIHLIIPSLVILFFIGLKDDILVIDPYKKLLAQILAAALLIYFTDIRISNLFGILGTYEISYIPSFVITLFVIVVIINAYNLIDGIDGLAAGIGIVAALTFGIYFYLAGIYWAAVLAAVLIGSLLAFIRFNFSEENKIFMGDSGSLIVGFILSLFAVKFIQHNEVLNNVYIPNAPTIAILILAVPLFDTLRVFTHRIAGGIGPFVADRNHIHHFIIDNGFSHLSATLLLSLCSIAVVSISCYFFSQSSVSYSFTGLIVTFILYSLIIRRDVIVKKPYINEELLRKKRRSTVGQS